MSVNAALGCGEIATKMPHPLCYRDFNKFVFTICFAI